MNIEIPSLLPQLSSPFSKDGTESTTNDRVASETEDFTTDASTTEDPTTEDPTTDDAVEGPMCNGNSDAGLLCVDLGCFQDSTQDRVLGHQLASGEMTTDVRRTGRCLLVWVVLVFRVCTVWI